MIIYSDKTKKKYETVDECLKAEAAFDEEVAQKEAEKKALATQKKERADEVVELYKAVREAEKKYLAARNKFVKDYGYFHMSFRDPDDAAFSDIFSMFKLF